MKISGTPANTDLLDRPPLCSCGQRMDLTRIDPHPEINEADVRHYECNLAGTL